ncbi:MAG: IS4 family transposase [Paludibacter sp.]|nr:IS4 family transposase [Paludibacter sp.]
MKTKASHKNSDLTSILVEHFGKSLNLARIKFISLFICALCKVQVVCFEKLASGFENSCDSNSSLRRIQRFMAEYKLDKDLIAKLIFALLPHKPPYSIAIDRTNWKFGQTNINILVLAIVYKGVAFPILFKLMPKRGNSHTTERIQIVNHYIRLFGKESLLYLIADREFVGEHWIDYLNFNRIEYHIRIRDNFWVTNPKTGKQFKATWLFADLKLNQTKFLHSIYYVNNQLCYLSASKIKNKEGKTEFQIVISFCKPEIAQKIYKKRWQIETAFRALKTSGFNIEDTHLTDIERIDKLLSLVLIAFTWSYLVGIYLHEQVKSIRILNNGRRAKSFFKNGLTFIASILLNGHFQSDIDIFIFLSCT